jgi:hypothetical protein
VLGGVNSVSGSAGCHHSYRVPAWVDRVTVYLQGRSTAAGYWRHSDHLPLRTHVSLAKALSV